MTQTPILPLALTAALAIMTPWILKAENNLELQLETPAPLSPTAKQPCPEETFGQDPICTLEREAERRAGSDTTLTTSIFVVGDTFPLTGAILTNPSAYELEPAPDGQTYRVAGDDVLQVDDETLLITKIYRDIL